MKSASECKIMVVGDVMVDEYVYGSSERLSKEAPVPIMKEVERRIYPGGAANVAANVVSLGAQVTLLGVVGDDEAGKFLQNKFEKTLIVDYFRPTTKKTRIKIGQQQIVRIDTEKTEPVDPQSLICNTIRENIKKYDVALIADYGKGVVSQEMVDVLVSSGKPVISDPYGDLSMYAETIVKVNFDEAQVAVQRKSSMVINIAVEIQKRYRIKTLLITCGQRGMILLSDFSGAVQMIQAYNQKVYDVCGAGDTVLAALGVGLAKGYVLKNAVCFSNAAAAVVVGKPDTATVTEVEVMEMMTCYG